MKKLPKIENLIDKLPVNQSRIDNGESIPKRTQSIQRIVVHCTDSDDYLGEDVYTINNYSIRPNHISSKGCFTIPYTYFIEKVKRKVKIFQCLNHNTVGWHVGIWNQSSLGVVINKKGGQLAPERKEVAIQLCARLCQQLNLSYDAVVFHRELQYTGWNWDSINKKKIYRKSCPGWVWNANKFRTQVKFQLMILKKPPIRLFSRFLSRTV